MRRIILSLAVLFMTVPAMAVSNVDITCTADGNEVTVSYESDTNLIRAFGLDITVEGANITGLVPVDANYRIFPGQIVIEDGNVTDYNTPYAPGDLGDANVTIEMGSLYTDDANYAGDPNAGYGMQPGLSGTLLKFYVDGDCNYAVTENSTIGGIVMEDPDEEPNVDDPLCSGSVTTECYAGMADYDEWVAVGKPECWCYPRQCHGDADGEPYGLGNYWVSTPDLGILKNAWNKPIGSMSGNEICADFDHLPYGLGQYRVSSPDLTIMKTYWNIPNGPDPNCDPGNREPE